jgi:hypothetical protein
VVLLLQVGVQAVYNHRAIQLSLLVACMYTAVGVLRLGFLTNFLSHSVIGGFTSGAAISESPAFGAALLLSGCRRAGQCCLRCSPALTLSPGSCLPATAACCPPEPAAVIGLGQFKYILGYGTRADKVHEAVHVYIVGAGGFKWQEYVMGSSLLT